MHEKVTALQLIFLLLLSSLYPGIGFGARKDRTAQVLAVKMALEGKTCLNEETIAGIRKHAQGFSLIERQYLYDKCQKSTAAPVLGTLYPYLGIAHFASGDPQGGMIVAGLQLGGIAVLVSHSDQMEVSDRHWAGYIGGGMLVLGIVYSIIRLWSVRNQFNSDLRRALHMSSPDLLQNLSISSEGGLSPLPVAGQAFSLDLVSARF